MCKKKQNIYGYVRAYSTDDKKGREFLTFQTEIIKRKYPNAEIVVEEWDFHTSKQRPVFNELIDKLVAGDVLVASHFERLFISWPQALDYIDKIRNKGAIIHSLDVGKIDDSLEGNLNLTIARNRAEEEFEMNKRLFDIFEQHMKEVENRKTKKRPNK